MMSGVRIINAYHVRQCDQPIGSLSVLAGQGADQLSSGGARRRRLRHRELPAEVASGHLQTA